MLTLQRASAGSGKTYTLARTFIYHLISISEEGRKPRLRTDDELQDALPHLLAVSFTNKSTNEMQQRIVANLYALCDTSTPADDVAYLNEFINEFGVDRDTIAAKCRIALKYLLLEYSDFNVSTIDSFFQTILRTFAFESELPDGYKLEIDSDFISTIGVDTMIDRLMTDSIPVTDDTYTWLKMLSKQSHNNEGDWNILNKHTPAGRNGKSLYMTLVQLAERLDNEEFKQYDNALSKYFDNGGNLTLAYNAIEAHFMQPFESAFAALRESARTLRREYSKLHARVHRPVARAKAIPTLNAVVAGGADPTSNYAWTALTARSSPFNKIGAAAATPDEASRIRDLYNDVTDKFETLNRAHLQPGWEVWRHLRAQIPYLALLHEFRDNIREYLKNNNIMVLADTNTMLRRIIGRDEVPFIYERIGTRIDHYMIDEFQDTSRMQWRNFKPLLAQSLAHANHNLIIGDAKQSIYRFRNADPSIITTIVPKSFPHDLDVRGDNIKENTNWRSELRIVQFNNYIFNQIHQLFADRIGDLYAGAVQYPKKQYPATGYVEWTPYASKIEALGLNSDNAPSDDTDEGETTAGSSDESENAQESNYRVIGPMITEMLHRGYRLKDIAILCNLNSNAMQIVEQLMAYNDTLAEGEQKLSFVSDQSLQLGENPSVQVVISALRALSAGAEKDFTVFVHSHPGEKITTLIKRFKEQRDDTTASPLQNMVRNMQATLLPALVEAIIDTLTKGADTPYLAALQDAVIDYCDMHSADINSFLEWWDKKGHTTSISSPEGTDAINIMTIHKSKGLEFECVILPDIDMALEPGINKQPWKWVRVPESFEYHELLPKYMPVIVTGALADNHSVDNPDADTARLNPFAGVWQQESDMVLVDALNKIYVAFTRAVSELYILTGKYNSASKKNPGLIADKMRLVPKLARMLRNAPINLQSVADDERMLYLQPTLLSEPIEYAGFTYGTKPTAEEVGNRIARKRGKEPTQSDKDVIHRYYTNADKRVLQFVVDGINPPKIDDEDTADPRSEGSIIHNILEYTEKYSDLHTAVTRVRIRGLLTRDEADELELRLAGYLEQTRHTCWFDGSCRIVNERPMLRCGRSMSRPDRIVITPDNRAIIIDYKTGTSEHNSSHVKQVKDYMLKLASTGRYKTVEGWLWYMKESKFQQV